VSLDGGDCAASLLERADARLYEAKRLGRNRIVAQAPPDA
jgi:PleD family two-component response regulator